MPVPAGLLHARILVVDDQDADARVVEAMLTGSGYTDVTIANDPLAALALHFEKPFELVILDVLMPGMGGFEVMRALHATNPDLPVPVIVVTAEPEHMKRALEEGARDFIGKPLRMVELLSRTRNALEMGRLLSDAEGRYRALVEQSIAGIYTVENGRFTYANPRLCEWLGYSAAELRETDTVSLVVEEDRARLLANRARRDAGHADAMVATYRLRAKDGHIVVLSFDARMIDLAGRKVIFGIAQDLTDREHARELLVEAESHYRALVEQSIVGIYLLGEQGLVYANPRLCEILGYGMAELAQLEARALFVPEDHALMEAVLERRRHGELGSIALECRARRKDGTVVHLGIESKIIELAGRKADIGVVQDVTLRKLAQNELRSANQRLRTLSDRVLEVQEEERRRISRELHDDIGQSLVALGIGLHRLAPHVAEAQQGLLAECIEVADDVREKVREISGELHPPHLDQLGLPDALRWLVARHHDMTGVEIQCTFADMDGVRIAPMIEAACYRICQEALNNATRHAQASRVTLELAARHGRLVLRVGDDGVGFDQAAQRAGAVTTGNMGLISMEERARLAGGRFELRSATGAGTCVSALFPIETRAESTGSRERV
ncbi:MAG TPA: PAS domain S-box protein [Usitatibacter sp.]|nr:PAS domain S-box protein [Usitatibacter sp.]